MSTVRLNISLLASRRHGLLLITAHGLLFLALAFLPVSPLLKFGLVLGLLANGYHTYRVLREQSEITRLVLEHEQLSVVYRGQWSEVQAFMPLFVTFWLTILRLKVGGKTYRLALWQDSANAEQMRQLRVWLLCGRWKEVRR